jgi:enamine deaminase RidA (YjgF/YER057c/UK114 family)
MAHEILKLKSVHATEGYSPVAKAGNTLYISGQVARDINGDLVGLGDAEAQTRQVLTNLRNIIEEVGGSMDNIVKLTTILTHPNYREDFRKVHPEFFNDPAPTNTLIVVQALALPEFFVEIEAIAVLD